MMANGLWDAIFAAMGQAFFTLSLGIGALAIFGSYIGKDRSLLGESLNVCILDTCVAFIAGLIIFPSCFSFNVAADSGPGLVFVTLPNVFNAMSGGRLWGFLFFLFMSFAAVTTIIAVFENIVAFAMDQEKSCSCKLYPDSAFITSLCIRLQSSFLYRAAWGWKYHTGSGGFHCIQ